MSLCITHHAKPTPVVSFCVPTQGIWIQYSETEARAITLIGCSRIMTEVMAYEHPLILPL